MFFGFWRSGPKIGTKIGPLKLHWVFVGKVLGPICANCWTNVGGRNIAKLSARALSDRSSFRTFLSRMQMLLSKQLAAATACQQHIVKQIAVPIAPITHTPSFWFMYLFIYLNRPIYTLAEVYTYNININHTYYLFGGKSPDIALINQKWYQIATENTCPMIIYFRRLTHFTKPLFSWNTSKWWPFQSLVECNREHVVDKSGEIPIVFVSRFEWQNPMFHCWIELCYFTNLENLISRKLPFSNFVLSPTTHGWKIEQDQLCCSIPKLLAHTGILPGNQSMRKCTNRNGSWPVDQQFTPPSKTTSNPRPRLAVFADDPENQN